MTNLLGSLDRAARVALERAGALGHGPTRPAPARSERPRRCFPDSAAPEDGCFPGSTAPSDGCFAKPEGKRSPQRALYPR